VRAFVAAINRQDVEGLAGMTTAGIGTSHPSDEDLLLGTPAGIATPKHKDHTAGMRVRTLSIAVMMSAAMAKWEAVDEIWPCKVFKP